MATKITGTNTAAAPGVTGDDTDTGLFYGTNEIGFSTGGTSRLTLDSSGNLNIPNDSGKIRLGTGADLLMYHDGTDSRIHNSTGELIFRTGSNYIFYNSDGTEKHAKFTDNGTVELYYDNSKKLHTNSIGVNITGRLYASDYIQTDADLFIIDNKRVKFGGGPDFQIWHDGSTASVIDAKAGDYLYIYSDNLRLNTKTGAEKYITGTLNGAVELYHDNVKTFSTDGNGFFSFGPEGGNANVYLYADEGDDDADKWSLEALASGSTLTINNRLSGSFEKNIECNGNGNVELYYDNNKKFETTSSGVSISGTNGDLLKLNSAGSETYLYVDNNEFSVKVDPDNDEGSSIFTLDIDGSERLRIDSSGNVGIGTTSPATNNNLHVKDASDRCYVTFESGGNESAQLSLKNPARSWTISNYYDGNSLTFTDDSDERLRIDSNGNVGIGSTSPVSQLELKNTNNGTPVGSTTTMSVNNTLTFTDTDTSATSDQCVGSINFKSSDSDGAGVNSAIGGTQSNTAYGQLDFNTGKVGGSGNAAVQRRVRIDHNGLNLLTGNVIVANGSGIDFSATSDGTGATSELFDNYEEGLHTCTATPQNGTVTLLSGTNTLAYTKVGRIVHVGGTVKVDSVSNPSGDMQLSMPFTVNDLTEQAGRTAGASFVHNSTDGNNDQVWAVWINEGTNDIWLRMPGTSGSANKVQANTEFFISISYPI